MNKQGISLIEVVVAVAIFVIGMLGSVLLQANALRATNKAKIIEEIVDIASAQLELERQKDLSSVNAASTGVTCNGTVSSEYSCSFSVMPCRYASGQLSCVSETMTDKVAHFIEVTVASLRKTDLSFTLSTVSRVE